MKRVDPFDLAEVRFLFAYFPNCRDNQTGVDAK
jgi:hypothetical protein